MLPGALPGPVRDVVEGTGEAIDKACDIPPWVPIGGPIGPIARELVC